jgi:carbohydrate-selective porin OprB
MIYRYTNVSITNLPVVATKIARQVGVMPTGLSDSGDTTEVMFATELTVGQKTILDSLMVNANVNVIPTTTNTVYTLADLDVGIKALTGLDFDMYPSQNGLVIQFTKVLTSQEKNSFRGAVANLLVIT